LELDKERLKRMFPSLARELGSDENKVTVNSVRTDNQVAERSAYEKFDHYTPDVIDFIRRCDTEQQAEEIVAYLEKKGELDKQHAERLRRQLKEKGVRSFGSKKEDGYYLKHGGLK
jgi:hypothetical protein